MRSLDAAVDASLWLAEEAAWEAARPHCSCCGEPIVDDYGYSIDHQFLCEECVNLLYREEIKES
jgi:formylmethanofuran dehydrogenase subunit E